MAHVLVIEDHPLNYELVADLLQEAGHVTHWAHDAQEGLAAISTRNWDLVLLDWHLPGLSGEPVLAEVRSRQDIPCIVLTADARPKLREDVLSLGACELLTKPLVARQFLRVVEDVLQQRLAPPSGA